jgi:hypothetical protein
MGRGFYVAVVIIDNDHGRRWGHHCHHRRSMVVMAGRSSSNQHRLWSSSSSTSTVVIVVVGIDCDHCRRWLESKSIVVILSSSLSEVMCLRASSLPSKAGVVIVHHRQQRNPGRGVRPMVVRRSIIAMTGQSRSIFAQSLRSSGLNAACRAAGQSQWV